MGVAVSNETLLTKIGPEPNLAVGLLSLLRLGQREQVCLHTVWNILDQLWVSLRLRPKLWVSLISEPIHLCQWGRILYFFEG